MFDLTRPWTKTYDHRSSRDPDRLIADSDGLPLRLSEPRRLHCLTEHVRYRNLTEMLLEMASLKWVNKYVKQ